MSDRSLGRFISLILRHKPETIGISLDAHGWADVDALITGINTHSRHHLTRGRLEHLVATNDKQRYSFNEDHTKIRANQGHSLNVDVELQRIVPPDVLYHGTATQYEKQIDIEGLKPRSRLYVHLSGDIPTAIKVGRRHGTVVLYEVDCHRMQSDGYVFYRSLNGVYLTSHVPVIYLRKKNESLL